MSKSRHFSMLILITVGVTDLTIYGYDGSYAEYYAFKNGFSFEVIEDP